MDRKLAFAVAFAVLLTGSGLAIAAPVRRATPRQLASNSETFQDSTGENPNAPDITTVSLSNDDKGRITLHAAVPNRTAFTDDMRGYLYFDTDLNVLTGSPDWFGAEYSVRLYLRQGVFVAGLYKWYGDEWINFPPSAPFSYAYDSSGLTLSIGDSDRGNARAFRFVFHLWSGVTVDPTSGNLDFSKGYDDSAPDDSVWLYRVETPDRVAPHAQALPASGGHGKALRLRFRVWDDSGRAREQLTLLQKERRVWTKKNALHGVSKARLESAVWAVPGMAAGGFRFCVQAWDAAGNTSRLSCAGVTVH